MNIIIYSIKDLIHATLMQICLLEYAIQTQFDLMHFNFDELQWIHNLKRWEWLDIFLNIFYTE